jgi:hypothetical protein
VPEVTRVQVVCCTTRMRTTQPYGSRPVDGVVCAGQRLCEESRDACAEPVALIADALCLFWLRSRASLPPVACLNLSRLRRL